MAKPAKVLLLENVHPYAAEYLESLGYEVELLATSLPEDLLIEKLAGVSAVGIRSATQITTKVIENSPDLAVVAAFCIGTNQIDSVAASANGVAVFNAPYANTRSVVELTLGEIIMLSRRVTERSNDMHAGIWNKSAAGSFEVRGKTLGIIGYGNIGSQLSTLAEATGMRVVFYDTEDKLALGNAVRLSSVADVLRQADVISIHVDGRPSNKNLIGAAQFDMMKDGSLFINNSRGMVVDVPALVGALKSGKLGGAACDVFPDEPDKGSPFASPLRTLSNVILTPHIGGSTEEAQLAIAEFASNKIHRYLATGDTKLSVNLPQLHLGFTDPMPHRLLYVHQNVPGVLAKVNGILTENSINVVGQYLATVGDTGYVAVDSKEPYSSTIVDAVRALPETVRLRSL